MTGSPSDPSYTLEPAAITLAPVRRFAGRLWQRAKAVAVCAAKFFVGVLLCANPLTALVVVGWAYRAAQRQIVRTWWRLAGASEPFPEFALGATATSGLVRWPNWILQEPELRVVPVAGSAGASVVRGFVMGAVRSLRALAVNLLGGLRKNVAIGFRAILNTWVLTMPACVLWLFAWYDGWNNSFSKGYEQAAVGPLIGLAGTFLFIGVMFYLPLAQARQASTGQWQAFYDFRLIRLLARRRWFACLLLAVAYSLLSFPLTVLKTVPAFFPQINPSLADVTPERAHDILRMYFFWAGTLLFPGYVLLRILAGRIYAGGLLDAVQKGAISEEALSEGEWETLHRLDLLRLRPLPPRPRWMQFLAGAGGRGVRAAAAVAIFLVWFTFIAQIFIGEFMNYHPIVGWLNQPLVQLPWMRYLPAQ